MNNKENIRKIIIKNTIIDYQTLFFLEQRVDKLYQQIKNEEKDFKFW